MDTVGVCMRLGDGQRASYFHLVCTYLQMTGVKVAEAEIVLDVIYFPTNRYCDQM